MHIQICYVLLDNFAEKVPYTIAVQAEIFEETDTMLMRHQEMRELGTK